MTDQNTPEAPTTDADADQAPEVAAVPEVPAPVENTDTKPADDDRKESAKYRKRAQEAEASLEVATTQLHSAQMHLLTHALGKVTVTAEALKAAGHTPENLVGEDGDIDRKKLAAAVQETAQKFGIPDPRPINHVPTVGIGAPNSSAPSWSDKIKGR